MEGIKVALLTMSMNANVTDIVHQLLMKLEDSVVRLDQLLIANRTDVNAVQKKTNLLSRMASIAKWFGKDHLATKYKRCLEQHQSRYPNADTTTSENTTDDMFAYPNNLEDYVTDLLGLVSGQETIRFMNDAPTQAKHVCDDKVRRKYAQLCDRLLQASRMSTPITDDIPSMEVFVVAYTECGRGNKNSCNRVEPKIVLLSPNASASNSKKLYSIMKFATAKVKTVLDDKTDIDQPSDHKFDNRIVEVSITSDKDNFINRLFTSCNDGSATQPKRKQPHPQSDSRKKGSFQLTLKEGNSSDSVATIVHNGNCSPHSRRGVLCGNPSMPPPLALKKAPESEKEDTSADDVGRDLGRDLPSRDVSTLSASAPSKQRKSTSSDWDSLLEEP